MQVHRQMARSRICTEESKVRFHESALGINRITGQGSGADFVY